MDQYFVKILANIVTIDQTSVSRDRAQRESELVIFCRAEPSSVSPGCRPLVYSSVEGEGALMGPTSQQTLWPATRVNSDEIVANVLYLILRHHQHTGHLFPSCINAYRDLNGSTVL